MKQTMLIAGVLFAAALAAHCGKKPAGETGEAPSAGVGDLLTAANEALVAQDTATAALEKATDGKSAARAINTVRERLEGIEKKFPQIKDFDKSPELASLAPKYKEGNEKFSAALMAAMQKYATDADFTAAIEKAIKVEK